MARLKIEARTLVLDTSLFERALDLRWSPVRVPLSAVRDIRVAKPYPKILEVVSFGFVGDTAPNGWLLSVNTRARNRDGGKAAVIVYLNRDAVVVDLAPNATPWTLIIASVPAPHRFARELRDALT